jgi:hypothetical protein
MNVEIGNEAPTFLFWEYLFHVFGILSWQCGTSFLKRVTGRILQLVNDFKEASRKCVLDFLHEKAAKNCENHQRSYNSTNLI